MTKEELTEQLRKLLAEEPAQPRQILRTNQAEINASLDDIAHNRAIVVDPPKPTEPRQLAGNEILMSDSAKISRFLPQIASGVCIVVPG